MGGSPKGMVAVRALDHIGIVVPDLDLASEWQRRILGASTDVPFVPGALPRARVGVTRLGGAALQLIELQQSKGRAFTLANHDAGGFHICLQVPDIGSAYERLSKLGVRFSSPPAASYAGPLIAYFRDPTGIQYQLLQLANGTLAAGIEPGPLGSFHHLGLTLPDLDEAVAWFEGVLGLTTTLRTTASGEQPSRMLEAPHAAYRAAMVDVGEQWLEIMEFTSPVGRSQLPRRQDVGALHLGFLVDDLAAAVRGLGEPGAEITLEPGDATGKPNEPGEADRHHRPSRPAGPAHRLPDSLSGSSRLVA